VTEEQRRVVVAALLMRRNGAASPEIVVARTGLGRVKGYSVLANLEREGLVTCCPFEGVLVSFSARMLAGVQQPERVCVRCLGLLSSGAKVDVTQLALPVDHRLAVSSCLNPEVRAVGAECARVPSHQRPACETLWIVGLTE
jgi:hypothetical protein